MMTNGTLDTRLAQNLVKEFDIPTNKEYDKFNPFKIGGGNAIWITHIPPNVKVWFSTDQNFDNAQRLDYMNRGMRYLKIGEQGITRLYDNFFIFTEGIVEDDFVKICVSAQGEDVEPILSSNTNQIDQVDSVGLIKEIASIKNPITLSNDTFSILSNAPLAFKDKLIEINNTNAKKINDNSFMFILYENSSLEGKNFIFENGSFDDLEKKYGSNAKMYLDIDIKILEAFSVIAGSSVSGKKFVYNAVHKFFYFSCTFSKIFNFTATASTNEVPLITTDKIYCNSLPQGNFIFCDSIVNIKSHLSIAQHKYMTSDTNYISTNNIISGRINACGVI